MPQPRKPLGVINGNIKKRKELTPFEKGQILGAYLAGATLAKIAEAFCTLNFTIWTTLLLEHLRNDGESRPRSGAPKQYTDYDERYILRFVRKNPKIKYIEIKRHYGLKISYTIIKHILRANGISS